MLSWLISIDSDLKKFQTYLKDLKEFRISKTVKQYFKGF